MTQLHDSDATLILPTPADYVQVPKKFLAAYLFMANIAVAAFVILSLVGCQGGPQGFTGAQGSAGADGTSCTTRVATADEAPAGGGVIVTCGPFSSFIANGPQGPQGANGNDATPARMVQLCPGTAVYPSVFLEYAICMPNGKLFAVYSIPGAFLTELTNGRYTSQAIGSSCNFTVSDNCTVTP